MSSQEDIAAIQVRIAKAESERDTWRSSGRQEKYLEAYSMVEALELQLDRLRKAPQSGETRPCLNTASERCMPAGPSLCVRHRTELIVATMDNSPMQSFKKHFVRIGPGMWTCVKAGEYQGPQGRIQVTLGSTLTKGTRFMGVDLAAILEQEFQHQGESKVIQFRSA